MFWIELFLEVLRFKMVWCTVCALRRGKSESVEILGPYEDVNHMENSIRHVLRDIRDEGMRACVVPFELCSDDIPELVQRRQRRALT
jgi:hypothetical protein